VTIVEQAQAALDAWDEAHQLGSGDHGELSMRFHQTQARRDRDLDGYLNRMEREARERDRLVQALSKAKRAELIASLPTKPIDPATIRVGDMIATNRATYLDWHLVKRINAKTVTCRAAPGYDEPRIPYDCIVARKDGKS
jgi:hypothetical protein